VGQHRSTQRYDPVPPDYELQLVKAMRQLAEDHPRYGYRRVHALLVYDGWEVNVKRVERLWRAEGLRVPPRRTKASGQRALGSDEFSAWKLPATHPLHVWSYDFVAIRTIAGSALRILNIVDEFTRACVGSFVARSIGARDVEGYLTRAFEKYGRPEIIRSDNGREFIASTLLDWLRDQGVTPVQVEKASPQQNCYVERFNGSMRDELLNGEHFRTLLEAQVVIGAWVVEYNYSRPHMSLGMRTPAAFAAYCSEQSSESPELATEGGK
jgi:transposase InsO family protein